MSELVLRAEGNGVCTITLNRPEHLNALNLATFRELEVHLDHITGRGADIRCVVLRGAGRSFCAGADLKDREIGDAVIASRVFKSGIIRRLAELPQPVVAVVKGHCMTGGLEFALTADIIIAGHSALFADTHGKWGLVSSWGMSQRLPRRIGMATAKELMFTARRISGKEAAAIGLANFCVPDAELDTVSGNIVADIVANSAHTNFNYKRILRETEDLPLTAGLAWEVQNHPGSAPDVQARIGSFRKG